MPNQICELRSSGDLNEIWTDCASPPDPPLTQCDEENCCTQCFSGDDTSVPSLSPSKSDTNEPTPDFIDEPTALPTFEVTTASPTALPSSMDPTITPTALPTAFPTTGDPTITPTSIPTITTISPTSTPTILCDLEPEKRKLQIKAEVIKISGGEDALEDPNSPQFKSFTYLVEDDIICPDNSNLGQRYALTVIYYSTNGDAWFECASSESTSPCVGNRRRLDDSDEENEVVRWLSVGVSECLWFGISCIDGKISELKLGEFIIVSCII